MARFTGSVGKPLPQDVPDKLAQLREGEQSPLSRVVYDSISPTLDFLGEKRVGTHIEKAISAVTAPRV